MAKQQTDNRFKSMVRQPASSGSIVSHRSGRPATKEEWRFNREFASQVRAQEGYEIKAAYGMALLGELSVTAAQLYAEEIHEYGRIKKSIQGEEYQAMGEQFIEAMGEQSGSFKLRITETAGSNIMAETHRPLYFMPENPTLGESLTGKYKY